MDITGVLLRVKFQKGLEHTLWASAKSMLPGVSAFLPIQLGSLTVIHISCILFSIRISQPRMGGVSVSSCGTALHRLLRCRFSQLCALPPPCPLPHGKGYSSCRHGDIRHHGYCMCRQTIPHHVRNAKCLRCCDLLSCTPAFDHVTSRGLRRLLSHH